MGGIEGYRTMSGSETLIPRWPGTADGKLGRGCVFVMATCRLITKGAAEGNTTGREPARADLKGKSERGRDRVVLRW